MVSLILPLAKINTCQTVRQQYPMTRSNWLKLGSQPPFPLVCQTWWLVPTIQGVFPSIQRPLDQCFALPGAQRGWMAWQLLSLSVPAPQNPERWDLGRAGSPHQPPELPHKGPNCSQSLFRNLQCLPTPQELFSSGFLLFPGWERQGMSHTS